MPTCSGKPTDEKVHFPCNKKRKSIRKAGFLGSKKRKSAQKAYFPGSKKRKSTKKAHFPGSKKRKSAKKAYFLSSKKRKSAKKAHFLDSKKRKSIRKARFLGSKNRKRVKKAHFPGQSNEMQELPEDFASDKKEQINRVLSTVKFNCMELLIKACDSFYYRNEEYVQYHTGAKTAFLSIESSMPKLGALTQRYLSAYDQVQEAFLLLRKSDSTDAISDADSARTTVLRGMIKAIGSVLNFPNADKKAAAHRIQTVMEGYGLKSSKLTSDKSAAIGKLIKDLQGPHANDVSLIGIGEWLGELIGKQEAYEHAVSQGFTEKAQKTQLRMKEVRVLLDAAYRALIWHIEAIIEVHGIDGYDTFVKEINVRIDKYNNTVAQRKGRNAKDEPVVSQP